jgi:hypothetical protein
MTSSIEKLQGHAAETFGMTFSMSMQHGNAARACSVNVQVSI